MRMALRISIAAYYCHIEFLGIEDVISRGLKIQADFW